MLQHSKRVIWIALLAAGIGSAAQAQKQPPVTPLMLQQWRLGQELGRYGLAQNDPVALLAAARLQRESRLRPSRARVDGDRKDVPEQTDPQMLLQRARTLAQGDPKLLELVDHAMPRLTRGTMIGPQVQPILMAARDIKPILLSYTPRQKGFFGVTTDRMEDVAVSVQGARNEPLCEPSAAGSELLCEWITGDAPDVRVTVTNRSANAILLTFFHD
jgi:hypothetical protein